MTLSLPAKIVVATHNKGKVREFENLLHLPGTHFLSASELNLPEPEETGDSFVANALLKARAATEASGLPALADDSGLCVEALNGDPGIYSARWAGEARDFQVAMKRVEDALLAARIVPTGAKAAFVAVLALTYPDGQSFTVDGRVEGTLRFPPSGARGFGYDPVFVPVGDTRSFAEMSLEEKAGYSHRARAVAKLKDLFA